MAKQGNKYAQLRMGELYFQGRGRGADDDISIPQNYTKSKLWFEKSAQQNVAEAQMRLARQYYYGQGTQKDFKRMFHWMTQSSQNGHQWAKFRLAQAYIDGEGTTVDYEKAINLLKEATENYSHPNGFDLLGDIYTKHLVGTKDSTTTAFMYYMLHDMTQGLTEYSSLSAEEVLHSMTHEQVRDGEEKIAQWMKSNPTIAPLISLKTIKERFRYKAGK